MKGTSWGLVFAALLVLPQVCTATLDRTLPAETLSGTKLTVPRDLPKKPVLFVIGFSKASETQTSAWSRALKDSLSTDVVAVYSVSIIEDVPRLLRSFVVSSIRKGVPRALHERFLLISQQASEWKEMASYQAQRPDDAYLVLTNVAREVVWRVSGPVRETSLQSLARELKSQKIKKAPTKRPDQETTEIK